jgi:hypothetical protein
MGGGRGKIRKSYSSRPENKKKNIIETALVYKVKRQKVISISHVLEYSF